MTSSLSFAELLVDNLKALNAKERDHLMRFAYLGETAGYADNDKDQKEGKKWLSPEMTEALHIQLAGTRLKNTKPPCVFACMDYHLDWLHAALLSTCHVSKLQIGQQKLCPDSSWTESSLQPVIGIQEDLDLLVVFADQKDTVVFCIEAKGVDSFNKVQMARKLIRLDRILLASDAYKHPKIEFKFVLVAPKEPGFKDCRDHACTPGDGSIMRGYFDKHLADIGRGMNFVELKGFPSTLKKITRTGPADAARGAKFTEWKIATRKGKTS